MVNQFWITDDVFNFSDVETRIYFFIVDVCIYLDSNSVFISNSMILVYTGCSRHILYNCRKRLALSGLISHEYTQTDRFGKYTVNDLYEGEEFINPYEIKKILGEGEIF